MLLVIESDEGALLNASYPVSQYLNLLSSTVSHRRHPPPQCLGGALYFHRKRRFLPKIHRNHYFYSGRASSGF